MYIFIRYTSNTSYIVVKNFKVHLATQVKYEDANCIIATHKTLNLSYISYHQLQPYSNLFFYDLKLTKQHLMVLHLIIYSNIISY